MHGCVHTTALVTLAFPCWFWIEFISWKMPEHNGKSVVIVEHFHHCQDSEPITLMETPFIEDVCRIDIICKSTNKPWTEINTGGCHLRVPTFLVCYSGGKDLAVGLHVFSLFCSKSSHAPWCLLIWERQLAPSFGSNWSWGWALLSLPLASCNIVIHPL